MPPLVNFFHRLVFTLDITFVVLGTAAWHSNTGIALSLIKYHSRPHPRVSCLPKMFGIPAGFIDLSEQKRNEQALPCKACFAQIQELLLLSSLGGVRGIMDLPSLNYRLSSGSGIQYVP